MPTVGHFDTAGHEGSCGRARDRGPPEASERGDVKKEGNNATEVFREGMFADEVELNKSGRRNRKKRKGITRHSCGTAEGREGSQS